MRLLPSGSRGLLLEVDTLEEVLGWYAALQEAQLPGIADIVPAGRTVLLHTDGATTPAALVEAVRGLTPRPAAERRGEVVEIPVRYDGEDLEAVGEFLGISAADVVVRHTTESWTVAFCGFAPGFGYLTGATHTWDIPRRPDPRTRVPTGAVALAGGFAGVYPKESPGGWQIIGRTDVAAFDLDREPAALLRPGVGVRFVVA